MFDNSAVPFLHGLRNSAIVSVLQTAGAVLVASMAGYGLARIPYRFANVVFVVDPRDADDPGRGDVRAELRDRVARSAGSNTYQGLIVPGMFQAFAAFLFRQYFLGFPLELEEAARIDGLSTWGTYWRIVVPNSKGIFAAVASITFIASWNAFLWPLVVGQRPRQVDRAGGAVVVPQLAEPAMTQLFVASAIAILPLLVGFLLLQRFIVEGVERTGITG